MLVDISERKQAEARQRALLAELNHRVKNNMQMLHGLLQAARRDMQNPEARVAIGDAIQRVGAMAAAQQVLYLADHAVRYETQAFLDAVCESAAQSFAGTVRIDTAADPATLGNDTAVPLALILNELLANAAHHGIDAAGIATIRVRLAQEGDGFLLIVEDDGPGFEFGQGRRRSSGLGLVTGLARQIGGTLIVERSRGARCTVRFRDTSSPAR